MIWSGIIHQLPLQPSKLANIRHRKKFMGIFSNIAFGNALTELTNLFEEIERTKQTHFIGAGGGIDSLPISRQRELEKKLPKWVATVSKHPQEVVTRELLKNINLSKKFGRHDRIKAQAKLMQHLVNQGIAKDVNEFLAENNF